MSAAALLILALGAAPGAQETMDLREALKDPARVFPAFQGLMAAGQYTRAYNNCLSPKTRGVIGAEEFQIAFSALDAARLLVASFRVHAVDSAGGALRVCSAEFGASRVLGLSRFLGKVYLLDISRDDFDFFRGRTLSWFRFQVKRADGWHFAYPPDWSYAPMARMCGCGK